MRMTPAHLLSRLGSRLWSWWENDPGLSPHLLHSQDLCQRFTLADLLPYQAYDTATGLYINHQSVGFVLEYVPLGGVSERIQQEWQAFFQDQMPAHASLQFLLWTDMQVDPWLTAWEATRASSLASRNPMLQAVAERRTAFLRERCHQDTGIPPRIFRGWMAYSVPTDHTDPCLLAQAQALKEHLLKRWQQDTAAWVVEPHHLLCGLDPWINPRWGSAPRPERDPSLGSTLWQEQEPLNLQFPSPETDWRVHADHLAFQDDTIRLKTYRVTRYPPYWALPLMRHLIGDDTKEGLRLPCPFFLHYGVHSLPQEQAQALFFHKIKMVEHQGRSTKLLKVIPALEEEVQEYSQARKQLHQGDKLVWTNMTLGLWDRPHRLAASEHILQSLFRSQQWHIASNRYAHLPSFLGCLPLQWGEGYAPDLRRMGSLKTTLAQEASHLIPLMGEWQGTPSHGLPFMGRQGQLGFWHPFDNTHGNYNTIVVGRSGSGKSVLMQEALVTNLGLGGRVFVLDVGRSFERTCLLLQGQFIAFDHHTPLCLNPFSRIPLDNTEVQEDTLSMLKGVLALMAAPTQSTTDYENALLEKALRESWQQRQHQTTITLVARHLEAYDDPRAKRLGVMLHPYTADGLYARYFEGINNVDFTNPLVVIELEELKEKKDLQAVVLQMVIMTITNQMFLGDRRVPFYITIDEAWDLLRGSQTGLFVETLARRLRKYNGALIVGTQSINDFYQTPGALAAFENSDWMLLLAQRKESIDSLKNSQRLTMDGGMEQALKSLTTRHGDYSEVLIYNAQEGYAIGRLCLDPFSSLLYSTQAATFHKLRTLQQRGISLTEAMDRVLREGGA